jgi:hypothetical protein
MPFVLQDWMKDLTFMQQSVLLTAIRGPDGLHKNHISKVLLRWYRRCILISAFEGRVLNDPYERCGGSFTGPCVFPTKDNPDIDLALEELLKSVDEVPHHWWLHFMHSAEILGYKHPDENIRVWWRKAYFRMANDMHLNCETVLQMDRRLGDNRDNWLAAEEVTAD